MPKKIIEIKTSTIDGTGCFATRKIKKISPVIEYCGEKISKAESLKRCEEENVYIFALDDETDLDGNVGENPAKYINHSCAPNCEAEIFGDMIWIMASRDIAAGEEITFNYNYGLEDYKEHPCRCGAANCAGFIVAEEFFSKFR